MKKIKLFLLFSNFKAKGILLTFKLTLFNVHGFSDEPESMVQSSAMTAVMADKDPPVFRDFLGIGRKDDTAGKQQSQQSAGAAAGNSDGDAEMSTKASSGTSGRFDNNSTPGIPPPFSSSFPPTSEPGSGAAEGWLRAKSGAGVLQHHGVKSAFYKPETENKLVRRRDSPIGRESLEERLQISVEALENSRPQKLARVENKDDKVKIRGGAPSVDELRLGMQPPRLGTKGLPLIPTAVPKPEIPSRLSKKPERPRPHFGGAVPGRLSQLEMSSERASAALGLEHDVLPAIAPPAADEGSRTGMKGSQLEELLNSVQQSTQATAAVSSGPASHVAPRRPKVSCHTGGGDPLITTRHQFTPPASRQLTIFYGGQAHVFDEVPPDKATQIMQLAGSSGRSWSTSYSSKQTASVANSASEESHPLLERDRDRLVNISHAGASQNGVSLALSTEVQTLLRGLAQSNSGAGSAGHGHSLPGTSVSPLTSDMQLHQALTDRVAVNGTKRESANGRTAPRPPSCTDDMKGKEGTTLFLVLFRLIVQRDAFHKYSVVPPSYFRKCRLLVKAVSFLRLQYWVKASFMICSPIVVATVIATQSEDVLIEAIVPAAVLILTVFLLTSGSQENYSTV
ncbi:hypothetical protein R1sor_026989 [Riccia sorocarpa]|uniref:Tify domain-containing protein n=1 Tax=Riccia sorocarpa TaxID=122646 RepID=A0ABD3GEN5_9MARC